MFGNHAIADYSALFAAIAATCVGFAALWSNPRRPINRLFFSASIHVSLWLLSQFFAVSEQSRFWARVTMAIGALTHFHLWLIKDTVIRSSDSYRQKLYRGRWWLLVGLALAGLCFSQWFISTPLTAEADVGQAIDSVPGVVKDASRKTRGFSFWSYYVVLGGLFVTLCVDSVRKMRTQIGVQRLELQLLLVGGSSTALAVLAVILLRTLTHAEWLTNLYPFVVLIFYTSTVVAITTSRVFNARQFLIVGLQKLILVSAIALVAYSIDALIPDTVSSVVTLLITISVALWMSGQLNEWLDRVFEFYPQGKAVRQAAFAVAQRERTVEKLEDAFRAVLAGWGHSDRALIVSGNKQSLSSGSLQLEGDGAVVRTMRELKWATPERLARERSTPDREALAKFLAEQQLGVLVIEDGLSLTTLVGVGVSASRRPFTYPQVTQLAELGAIVESALERAHFSAKIQHTEQLATVGVLGASLAHEIRNPLVSIKTFVQLLPTHYNDPAFRNKFFRLIGDEVSRIDQLTDQLLDLSAPRAYMAQMIDLHPFLLSGLDLVAAKASHRQVQLQTDFQASPDRAFTDASAAKQVMLNLCFNAIQAVEACEESARWVKIATRNVGDRIEMSVSDGGPGIAPEIRPKLFQPFQTTKSTGFGLGLAVCSDILANLHASISVDPPEPGRGATFRVTFPCQPLSS